MKKLFIEIADTPEKREQGLMYRKNLAKNQGMLFKFPYNTFASFWMKNTYIPLDIAFLNEQGRILQIESMSPLNTKAVYSNHSCKYALEVNKGWFTQNGITVGSKIDGEGIRKHNRTAQTLTPLNPSQNEGAVTGIPEIPPGQPQTGNPAQPSQPPQPDPDVMLNLSYKDRIKAADIKKQDLIIIYECEESGRVLPPKTISPPYKFEKDKNGTHDALFKAWDNQTGGPTKSFLVDNILSLEEKRNKGNQLNKKEIYKVVTKKLY